VLVTTARPLCSAGYSTVVATADVSRIQADIPGVFALRLAELSKARGMSF
jgi:hypothetical protein